MKAESPRVSDVTEGAAPPSEARPSLPAAPLTEAPLVLATTEPDAMAELHEVADVLRTQAGRIAALQYELDRAHAAAEAARLFALQESTRRVEVQEQLHAVHRTKVWRYSRFPRRVYARLRRLG